MSYTAKKWTSDEINKAIELFEKEKIIRILVEK